MDAPTWNSLVAGLPDPHILQTWQWGALKARFDWQPFPTVWHDRQGKVAAAALVLGRSLPRRMLGRRLQVMYVPKGPLLRDWEDAGLRRQVFTDLRALARREGAIFIKIDPDVRLGSGIPAGPDEREAESGPGVVADLQVNGWRYSEEQVQFRNTVLVDLSAAEDEILSRMKQKTRYNIRLAARKGVVVRPAGEADLELIYHMYSETALRDGFAIREPVYYQAAWGSFMEAGMAEPLVAEVDGQPVAAVVIFRFAGKAWYMFGMSREVHREKMANYLLQWEAMKRAKAAGCKLYDFWGAPEEFHQGDPLWGVYRFKEGFGGYVVRHIGAWDLPVRPLYYRLYTHLLPRLLDWMRRRGMARTRAEVQDSLRSDL